MKRKYMFDTNIFNKILDNKKNKYPDLDLSNLKGLYCITHIQKDELETTANEDRRRSLLEVFSLIRQDKMPTESAVWGVSKFDECY